MKLSQNLNDALNSQVSIELGNELKYMQVQSYFENLQLVGLSKFFKSQADGEHDHANLFMDYVNDRNGMVIIVDVDAPKSDFSSIDDVANFYILTEQQTTESIESLYDMALSEKSYLDLGFLSKMLDEQVEEENTSQRIALNLKMVKDIVLYDKTFE